jgi:hypothetical protein
MPTFWRSRLAQVLLVPMLLAVALLSTGAAHLATASHSGGAVADCPAGTNWDAGTGTCQ